MFVKHGWVATNSTNHVMLRSWQKCSSIVTLATGTRLSKLPANIADDFSRNEEFIRISQRVVEDHFTPLVTTGWHFDH